MHDVAMNSEFSYAWCCHK